IEETTGLDGHLDCNSQGISLVSWNIELTLRNQPVEVLVTRSFDPQIPATDIIDCLIVNHEAAVRMLQGGMGRQDGIVWFNDRRGILRGRIHTEFQLCLLAIVYRQTLHQECTESRSGSAPKGVENQESLKAGTVIC